MSAPQVVLTGGTGFLGSRVAERLKRSGCRVIPFSRGDAPDRLSLAGEFTLIHCAGDYARGANGDATAREANVEMPRKLVQALSDRGLRGIVSVGTALPPETGPYAATKAEWSTWMRDQLSDRFPVVDVVLQYFYGEDEPADRFVSRTLRAFLAGADRIPLTSGFQKRDFFHVDDAVQSLEIAYQQVLKMKTGYLRLDAGSGTSLSIREFVEWLKVETGTSSTYLDFGAVPLRPGEPEDCLADLRAIRELGYIPRVSLKDGVRRAIVAIQNSKVSGA